MVGWGGGGRVAPHHLHFLFCKSVYSLISGILSLNCFLREMNPRMSFDYEREYDTASLVSLSRISFACIGTVARNLVKFGLLRKPFLSQVKL